MFKDYIHKIKEYFAKGGSNWIILVISLLLAFFMWSIVRLTENYSAYLKYWVSITTNLSGRANSATSTAQLYINANISGFKIMENNISDDNVILLENLNEKYLKKYKDSDNLFYLLTDDVKQRIQDAIGVSMQIDDFATDTVFFDIPVQSNKKVPVIVPATISYASQYMPTGDMVLSPDSVYVYGDDDLIAEIESVSTSALRLTDVDESFNGVIKLVEIEGVRLSNEEIYYAQKVVRYVESSIESPVSLINAPSNYKMLIWPKNVKFRYRVQFENAKPFTDKDFEVALDYHKSQESSINKPEVVKYPKEIIYYSIEPKFVECLF